MSFNPLVSCGACAACLAGRQNVCSDWRLFGLDRVHGTYAEYVSVPACQLHALSEELPEKEAILVEPLAVVVHAFRIAFAEIPPAWPSSGAGPIGALALAVAKLRGVPRVVVTDMSDERLEVAKTLGADLVGEHHARGRDGRAAAFTEGGAECVVEAVGWRAPGGRRCRPRRAAPGSLPRHRENESTLPWIEMVRNEQAVFTSFAYTPRDFAAAVRLVEARRFDLKPWTETRPLARARQAS